MRRTFRREVRNISPQEVLPALQEANYAFTNGDYGRAAELFEQVARTADDQGNSRASNLYLRAGHARILAKQELLGIPSIRRGLELLAKSGKYQKLHQAGTKAMAELKSCGLSDEATVIQKWLKSILPEVPTAQLPVRRPALPAQCPSCAALLRPDDVEWIDKDTAECGYCGNAVR